MKLVAARLSLCLLALGLAWCARSVEPPYITDHKSHYTAAEFHQEVRGWLEKYGYYEVCMFGGVDIKVPTPAETNRWRMMEIIVEECNDVSMGRRPL